MSSTLSSIKKVSGALIAGSVIATVPTTISAAEELALVTNVNQLNVTANQLTTRVTGTQLSMTDFLVLLSEDANLQLDYLSSPQLTMNAYGLDDLSIAALMTGNVDLLQGVLGDTQVYRKHIRLPG